MPSASPPLEILESSVMKIKYLKSYNANQEKQSNSERWNKNICEFRKICQNDI